MNVDVIRSGLEKYMAITQNRNCLLLTVFMVLNIYHKNFDNDYHDLYLKLNLLLLDEIFEKFVDSLKFVHRILLTRSLPIIYQPQDKLGCNS